MIRGTPLAIALAAASLAAAPAFAQGAQADFPPAISVSGEASVSAPPDLATIDAGVSSDGKTAREAAEANNTAMAKVLQALKAAGIDDKDYQTSRLSLQPQYTSGVSGVLSRSAPTVAGYRAGNHVTVKLHDVSKIAAVIDTLVSAGANEIGGINFTVSQASRLLDEAREKAVADARRKAEIYAKAAGVALGTPLSISEGGAAAPMFRAKALYAQQDRTSVPIAQGEETLSITVNVTWAIKPGQ